MGRMPGLEPQGGHRGRAVMGLSEHSGAITVITASWRRQAEHGVTYPVYILARRALSLCGLDGWPLSNDQFCVRTDCTKPRIYGVFDSESMNTLNVLAVLTPRYASMAQTRSIYIYIDGQSRLWHRVAQPGTPRVTAVVSHMAPNTRIGWYFTHHAATDCAAVVDDHGRVRSRRAHIQWPTESLWTGGSDGEIRATSMGVLRLDSLRAYVFTSPL